MKTANAKPSQYIENGKETVAEFKQRLDLQNRAIEKLIKSFSINRRLCLLCFILTSFSVRAQQIDVSGNGKSINPGEEARLSAKTDFGNVLLGSDATSTFSVTNGSSSGNLILKRTSSTVPYVEISGLNKLDFGLDQDAYDNGLQPFKIRFQPTTGGLKKAIVTIRSNSLSDSVFVFEIIGYGAEPIDTPTGSTESQIGHTLKGVGKNDGFGRVISMSGDGTVMAIRAKENQVKVFKWGNGAWVQLGSNLNGKSSGDKFGHSISVNGDGTRVAIGAPGVDSIANAAGRVTVYKYNTSLNKWQKKGNPIDGKVAKDGYGEEVSLSENGAHLAILSNSDSLDRNVVMVFDLAGSNWSQHGQTISANWRQEITTIDLSSNGMMLACGQAFALNAAISPYPNWAFSGCVTIFRREQSQWHQISDPIYGTQDGQQFGGAVAINSDGSTLAVGVPKHNSSAGKVEMYALDYFSYKKYHYKKVGVISGESSGDHFGLSVSITDNGDMVAIGAPFNDPIAGGLATGHARVYGRMGTSWKQLGSDIDGNYEFELTGNSVSISSDGSRLAVGFPAPYGNLNNIPLANESGEVRAYQLTDMEVKVTGNGTEIETDNQTTSFANFSLFAPANYDSDTTVRRFEIRNSGVKPLALLWPYLNITGKDSMDFKIIGNPANHILPDSSTSILIEFNPSSVGQKEATIEIYSNDANESTYELNIAGNGNYQIRNGGSLTTTMGELTISSSENQGYALQDIHDKIILHKQGESTGVTTANLPGQSIVNERERKHWQLKINDADTLGGQLEMSFQLSQSPSSDFSYYLLTRTGTNGNFVVVNNLNYVFNGNNVVFTTDLSALRNNRYYTIGWSKSGPGNCLDLDGTDDYISLNSLSHDLANGDATFEGWFLSVDDNDALFSINTASGGNKCMLYRNRVWDKTAGMGINHTHPVNDTLWHHYALIIDATDSVKVFIDGALANSFSSSSWSLTSTNQISIGQEWDGLSTSQHLNGRVDEVRIWNDIRTREELIDNMFKALSGTEANLVSYYKFDQETENYLPDAATGSNQGQLVNFGLSGTRSNWVSSKAIIIDASNANRLLGPDNALDLAGDDDYVNIPSMQDPAAGDWTFEAWIYPENLSNTHHVVLAQKDGNGTGDTYLTFENGVPKLTLGPNKKAVSAIATHKWYHVALSYDQSATLQTLYIDGIKIIENVGSISTADGTIVLGRNKYGNNYFNGKIDDLRFWSTCRAQAEIQDNMYANLAGDEQDLTAYYDCNHSSGTGLEDKTGNGYNGTLKNFSGTYWVPAASREPFKTVRAGNHGANSTWKGGTAPSSSADKLAVFHDLTLASSGTYSRLQVNSGNTIATNADVTITGEVIVNGTANGTNKIILGGSGKQSLAGSGTLGALQINNSNDVSLEGDLSITGTLTLTDGDIEVNNHTLTLMGTTSHGSSNSYLKINGTGLVKATVGSDPVILPIGRNPYLPIIIDDGGDAEYTVSVANNVYDNPETQANALSSNAVTETWAIQASSSVNNVIVQVGWDPSEEASFDRTACALGYWEEGASAAWNNSPTVSAATGSGPYFQSRTLDFTTNLFYFGVGGSGSTLPVELTYFNAQWLTSSPLSNPDTESRTERPSLSGGQGRNHSALLTWQTAVEENNSHFEIQRTLSGVEGSGVEGSGPEMSWETIGRVEGQGTTFQNHDYEFVDLNLDANESTVYYRLKQVDYNGQFEYSAIRTLTSTSETFVEFSLYPNPSSGQFIYTDVEDTYRVRSITGRTIKTLENTTAIFVGDLESGTYVIENSLGNTELYLRN